MTNSWWESIFLVKWMTQQRLGGVPRPWPFAGPARPWSSGTQALGVWGGAHCPPTGQPPPLWSNLIPPNLFTPHKISNLQISGSQIRIYSLTGQSPEFDFSNPPIHKFWFTYVRHEYWASWFLSDLILIDTILRFTKILKSPFSTLSQNNTLFNVCKDRSPSAALSNWGDTCFTDNCLFEKVQKHW